MAAGPHAPSCLTGALQDAVTPPLVPLQVQDHDPVLETEEAEPTEQRLEDGAVYEATPLALPQTPSTDLFALQDADGLPLQVQTHGPLPEGVEAVPLEHKLDVGAE